MSIDRRATKGFVLLATCVLVSWIILPALSPFFLCLLACHLLFFRDPRRDTPSGEGLLSPADGRIADISTQPGAPFLDETVVRIGVVLSIFNCHINRIPATGKVLSVEYKPGKFFNAFGKEAALRNSSNDLVLESARGPLIVRQMAGAIARRIFCDVKAGDSVSRGEKFGIICYGSRTELWVPKRLFRPAIAVGQKVKAGQTVLGDWIS